MFFHACDLQLFVVSGCAIFTTAMQPKEMCTGQQRKWMNLAPDRPCMFST